MKIRKVTLENVKSYQKEVVEFHDGINVIAGRNGAGKSTLIEAIGFALFGYMNKDYSFQEFVSYGASSGAITVEFEVDNCRYQIERTFTTRGTKDWRIYDLQTDELIETHRSEDVNYALARILGMGEEGSLAELFERIIGVSQGTFTEPFLRSPGGRKEYFERIFMLDSYKAAYSRSSDAASLLRDQCDNLEKELIRLRTRIETYPELKAQYKEREKQLTEHREQLTDKLLSLEQVRSAMQELKNTKERVQTLESERLRLTDQQAQLQERLQGVNAEIEVSERAKELVEAYQATHETYLQVKAQIGILEAGLEEQERLTTEKQELEKYVAATSLRIQTQRENVTLTRQNCTQEDQMRREELEEYLLPLEGIDRELRTVEEELGKLSKVQTTFQEITESYHLVEKYFHQLDNRLTEYLAVGEEIADLDQRLQLLPILQAEVEQLSGVERELAELNHTISAVKTRIASEEENMEQVGDGLCPLLKTECKTIEGQSLREYFTDRVAGLKEELAAKTIAQARVAGQLQTLRQQAQQLAVLETLVATRAERQAKAGEIAARGKELVQSITGTLRVIYENLANLQKAGYLAEAGEINFVTNLTLELQEERKRLCTEIDIVANHLTCCQTEMKDREKAVVSRKEGLAHRKAEFTGKISQIDGRRNEIRRKLAELAFEDEKLAADERTLRIEQEKIDDLAASLESTGDLKGELKKARETLASLEEGNQIYLTNQQKANEVTVLRESESRLTKNLADTGTRLKEVAVEHATVVANFNPEQLTQLETEYDGLNRQISEVETLLREGEKQLQETSERLKEMDQIKAQIKEREGEETRLRKGLDLMNFIRSVYNTSAEDIAQVFLQFISHEATNIYRQLSGENVQLVWEKDYQVKLKDKHRVRIFKQLSGGEQMSAAFAIRLALLRKFSTVRLGFFDEPTTHLDEYRRVNIAQAIASIREKSDDYFEQIFVISHDDTFTTLTENLIRLEKGEDGSYLAG